MAGRGESQSDDRCIFIITLNFQIGCSIRVEVLGGASGNGQSEELSLPVALHSPLEVLREQLEGLTNIRIQDQVLILCDLRDPERNSDVLLTGRDHMTLRDCGIRNGAVLTLHALGLTAERKMSILNEAKQKKEHVIPVDVEPIYMLTTPITAAQANHSYNGIIFDVASTGSFEVDVTSIWIGGMLGRVVSMNSRYPPLFLRVIAFIYIHETEESICA